MQMTSSPRKGNYDIMRIEGVAWPWGTCLACLRPWVHGAGKMAQQLSASCSYRGPRVQFSASLSGGSQPSVRSYILWYNLQHFSEKGGGASNNKRIFYLTDFKSNFINNVYKIIFYLLLCVNKSVLRTA